MTDIIVTVTVLVMLFIGFGYALSATRAYNRYNMARQRCAAACRAQMDSIAVRGQLIEPDTVKRLWEEVSLKVDKTAGRGQWQGMDLVKIIASSKVGKRKVNVSIERYIRSAPEPPEIKKVEIVEENTELKTDIENGFCYYDGEV